MGRLRSLIVKTLNFDCPAEHIFVMRVVLSDTLRSNLQDLFPIPTPYVTLKGETIRALICKTTLDVFPSYEEKGNLFFIAVAQSGSGKITRVPSRVY